jgi:DNA polymerase III subunit alpha
MTAAIRKLNEKAQARADAQAVGPAAAAAPTPASSGTIPFVHLKVHSAYSLLEGALPIGKIAKIADKYGYPAIGLTDTNNMFGVLEFSDKLSGAGIQPIVGVTLATDFLDARQGDGLPRSLRNEPASKPAGALALLASNDAGYANLMLLASRAYLGTVDPEPTHIKIDALEACADGLIALTGGPDGPIDRALRDGQREVAGARLKSLSKIFGDRLYVEIQRHGLPHEAQVEPQLLELAYELGIPLVATNEVYFADASDYEAHDALICIAGGNFVVEDNRRRLSPEHGFKSPREMAALFADLPEALANTIEIARRCAFRPKGRKPILPRFVQTTTGASEAEQLAAEAAEMKRQAEQGLADRLAVTPLAAGFTLEDYQKRLAFEIDVITQMKFPGYFLIVADFIKWAKAHDIPVGPGRGSGAGSVVAWALTITDLDPLRFGLLFERFLNPERVSMPDFDIDFCQDRRDEVIRYVQKKYGSDRVAQIITHGKLQARAVLRDVGRVLQMPYGQVDRLCKMVPNNPANPVTLSEAIEAEPKLQDERDNDPMVAKLLEISQKLEGLYRHASTHAAGMVIGDRPLDQLVPLYRDPKSDFAVTQFNMKLVEQAGLVKFDFLGLKTLTVLQKCVAQIKRGRGIDVDLLTLPLDDKPTYALLAKADTVGVFQLESTGMRDALKKLKPDRFDDIIAMVSLYRPGPMDNIPTYINRKHGEEPVDCLHPLLEGILKETYGVIIYQEQVIQIAQVMGGYSLGQADLLRRAMGKKDKAEMAKQQARFVEGAVERGVKKGDAAFIFELVDKFAGYGFNKSHAAAYALVSYHTAYLKANFREEFLAASMTLDLAQTDKLATFASEARRAGIEVLPPCANGSFVDFVAVPPPAPGDRLPAGETPVATRKGSIRYSLAALKNIGPAAVQTVIDEREAHGPFKDLADFARRLNPKTLNKRGLEMLSAAGAFDAFEPSRSRVHGNVEQILALAGRLAADAATGMTDMFGGGSASANAATLDLRAAKAWTPMERLDEEFKAIGFYLSGHPLDAYETTLTTLNIMSYVEFLSAVVDRGAKGGRLAGIVVSARERRSAKGNKFAFAMFSDQTGSFEAVIFSDTLDACGHLLEAGTAVVIAVEAERDGDTVKMRVQGLEALDTAAANAMRGLKIILAADAIADRPEHLADLRTALKAGIAQAGRGAEVHFVLRLADNREVDMALPRTRFSMTPVQIGALTTLPGVLEVIEL